ncbi:hypothetical protein HWI79_2928 [Cryptosporidium felis]|nr:hypothetical protein HWI79_2928 [Cryptosporidium felis]
MRLTTCLFILLCILIDNLVNTSAEIPNNLPASLETIDSVSGAQEKNVTVGMVKTMSLSGKVNSLVVGKVETGSKEPSNKNETSVLTPEMITGNLNEDAEAKSESDEGEESKTNKLDTDSENVDSFQLIENKKSPEESTGASTISKLARNETSASTEFISSPAVLEREERNGPNNSSSTEGTVEPILSEEELSENEISIDNSNALPNEEERPASRIFIRRISRTYPDYDLNNNFNPFIPSPSNGINSDNNLQQSFPAIVRLIPTDSNYQFENGFETNEDNKSSGYGDPKSDIDEKSKVLTILSLNDEKINSENNNGTSKLHVISTSLTIIKSRDNNIQK